MRIANIIEDIPAGADWQEESGCALLLAPPREGVCAVAGLGSWLALQRRDYWMTPCYGSGTTDLPDEVQFLIGALPDGQLLCLIPLVTGDTRCSLAGGEDGLRLCARQDAGSTDATAQPLLAAGVGTDPHVLVEELMACAASALGSFRLRRDKPRPGFQDWFGWCTWDAFYHAVDAQKVRAGLQSFATAGRQPGFMILDDGWQDTPQKDWLRSFATDAEKFPEGLRASIAEWKEAFALRCFGIWHCFEGYWAGLDPEGELAQRYPTIHCRNDIRPWEKPTRVSDIHMIDPAAIASFYGEWYEGLRRAGVDLIKVDGQSALDLFTDGAQSAAVPRVAAMDAYQHALQAHGCASFPSGVLHCMCHSNDVLFRMFSTNAWRNSQDYMPKQARAAQQRHLQLNAATGVFVQSIAWPDWDMFQTHGAEAELHAVGRAISGGPVYVCDKPGEQDPVLLRRIACSDGSVPCFDRPAQITTDRLLVDVGREDRLLKVHNRSGTRAVMALFHCRQDGEEPISDSWRVAEISGCQAGTHAVWQHDSQELSLVQAEEELSCTLAPAGWALATVAPLGPHAAVLGLLDLFAGAAAVREEVPLADGLLLRVQDGGRLGLYAPQAPSLVQVDGSTADCQHDADSGLTVIGLADGPHTVELRWA